MELKVFGSSGGIESEERHSACYFLKGLNLFLDFGSGSFRAKEHLKGVDKISILLSHLHHDHIKGLPFLFEVFSGKEVDIYVPKGMKDDFYRYCEPPYWALPFTSFPFRINIMEMEDEFEIETLGGTVNVQTRSFEHPGGITGFRISDGKKTLVYMTDVRSGGNGFGKAVEDTPA